MHPHARVPMTQDCSGTIDRDECMEIFYRRFGANGLEAKVSEFMALVRRHSRGSMPARCSRKRVSHVGVARRPQDTDGDAEQTIAFAEYMVGINRVSQVPDPGFKISQVRAIVHR